MKKLLIVLVIATGILTSGCYPDPRCPYVDPYGRWFYYHGYIPGGCPVPANYYYYKKKPGPPDLTIDTVGR